MDSTGGLFMILGALFIGFLIYKFDKGQGIIDKLFKGVVYIGCIVAIIGGVASIIDDSSSDIGDRYGSSDYYDDTDEESSSGEVSFKGRNVIVDYNYGGCDSGCGCTQYKHYPGQTACVSCEENGCSTNKFGHNQ